MNGNIIKLKFQANNYIKNGIHAKYILWQLNNKKSGKEYEKNN